MEIAVVGDPTFALGFKLAGVRKTHEAEDAPALQRAVQAVLDDDGVGILVMQTADVRRLEAGLQRELEARVKPTLVAIGVDEDTGLREKLKQAVGVDLWK